MKSCENHEVQKKFFFLWINQRPSKSPSWFHEIEASDQMTKFHQIPSLLSCPTVSYQNNTKIAIFFAVNKNEVALISSKLSQLTGWFRVKFWRGIAYFVQNNTTIIQPGDTRRIRASYHAMPDAVDAFFGAKLGAWSKILLHIFPLLQSDRVFGNVNPFSWKVNASPVRKVTWFECLSRALSFINWRRLWQENGTFQSADE